MRTPVQRARRYALRGETVGFGLAHEIAALTSILLALDTRSRDAPATRSLGPDLGNDGALSHEPRGDSLVDCYDRGCMRGLLLCLVIGCGAPVPPPAQNPEPVSWTDIRGPAEVALPDSSGQTGTVLDPSIGTVIDRMSDFVFDGGRIQFEMRRDGERVIEVAYNRYAVPIMIQWEFTDLENLEPLQPSYGVIRLPAAGKANAPTKGVVMTTFSILDRKAPYHRRIQFHARFGDPTARPEPYAYRLPYTKTFAVLQGFHGAFSHRGSNEYAIDFDCPVATHVLATRPGLVVAANASAQGAGTTPEFLEYRRTNFVIVLHDDGTLGEYMHLAPSSVEVRPGQRVERGAELALSGNTGFSSTPHLHFQVMTAGDDGVSARSFPFQLATAPNHVEEPVQGRSYTAWE
jgi:murein DD-endopeptidase MepM/ murein hydrolase activator NlpD